MLVRYARRDRYVMASQWRKDGDHPMVRPYRNDWVKEDAGCRYCGKLKKFHGHLLVRDSDGELIMDGQRGSGHVRELLPHLRRDKALPLLRYMC